MRREFKVGDKATPISSKDARFIPQHDLDYNTSMELVAGIEKTITGIHPNGRWYRLASGWLYPTEWLEPLKKRTLTRKVI